MVADHLVSWLKVRFGTTSLGSNKFYYVECALESPKLLCQSILFRYSREIPTGSGTAPINKLPVCLPVFIHVLYEENIGTHCFLASIGSCKPFLLQVFKDIRFHFRSRVVDYFRVF
jgi:hypothetical protein